MEEHSSQNRIRRHSLKAHPTQHHQPSPLRTFIRTKRVEKTIKTRQPQSWGRYPKIRHSLVQTIYWRNELPDLSTCERPILPYAYGRSYGDSCLNENGIALDVSYLRRFISFDETTGLLRCE